MLNNRAYIGEAVHKGDSYPGEHDAIIDHETWDRVHAILQESPRKRAARTRAETPALLKGLLFGPDGAAFSPTHTRKGDKLYRYYVSQTVLKHGAGSCPVGRVPAGAHRRAVGRARRHRHERTRPPAPRRWADRPHPRISNRSTRRSTK
jgi:site-specific DNA recombinase